MYVKMDWLTHKPLSVLEGMFRYTYLWHVRDDGRYCAVVKCNGHECETLEGMLTEKHMHSVVLEYYPTAICRNGAFIEE